MSNVPFQIHSSSCSYIQNGNSSSSSVESNSSDGNSYLSPSSSDNTSSSSSTFGTLSPSTSPTATYSIESLKEELRVSMMATWGQLPSIPRQKDDRSYLEAAFLNELQKEDKYMQHFTRFNYKLDKDTRTRMVNWVISASNLFKYSTETIYIAVYVMDAVGQTKAMRSVYMVLLGVTALHVASKLEEPNRLSLKYIWKYYSKLTNLMTLSDVIWLESEVLNILGFLVNPPTPKVFADLYFATGKFSFMSEEIEKQVKSLTNSILLQSLQSYEMNFVKPSVKAELAILVASEYVKMNAQVFLQKEAFLNCDVILNAIPYTYSIFYDLAIESTPLLAKSVEQEHLYKSKIPRRIPTP